MFTWLEGWPVFDAFYMTIITITTVGFGEVRPLSPVGRVVTILLILLGVGGFTYTFTTIADYVVSGELGGMVQAWRIRMQIDRMKQHIIVCGFGRVGSQVVRELERGGALFVIVDSNPDSVERARDKGYAVLEGNAGVDEVLLELGIMRARGLITCVDSDASNLLVTLSARALNPNLYIVARANLEDSQSKLLLAGANRVLSPYSIGGRRMAEMLLRPDVVDFLDVIMRDEELELQLENLTITSGCELEDATLGSANIRSITGANILAIKTKAGILRINPNAAAKMEAGDVLMVLGTRRQLATLQRMINKWV